MLQIVEVPKCALTLSATLNASIVGSSTTIPAEWAAIRRDPVDRFWSACKTSFPEISTWQDKIDSGLAAIRGGEEVNWYFQPQTFFYDPEQIDHFLPFDELGPAMHEVFVNQATIRNFDLDYWLGSLLNDSDHTDDNEALLAITGDESAMATIQEFYAADYAMIQHALDQQRN